MYSGGHSGGETEHRAGQRRTVEGKGWRLESRFCPVFSRMDPDRCPSDAGQGANSEMVTRKLNPNETVDGVLEPNEGNSSGLKLLNDMTSDVFAVLLKILPKPTTSVTSCHSFGTE